MNSIEGTSPVLNKSKDNDVQHSNYGDAFEFSFSNKCYDNEERSFDSSIEDQLEKRRKELEEKELCERVGEMTIEKSTYVRTRIS